MNTTTQTMSLNQKECNVTFVSGKEYGFCLDTIDSDYIAIVGVASKSSVEIVGGIGGLVRNDAKGLFVVREVVRRLNTDVVSEGNIVDAIKAVRSIV
jgi:hypothetical protein